MEAHKSRLAQLRASVQRCVADATFCKPDSVGADEQFNLPNGTATSVHYGWLRQSLKTMSTQKPKVPLLVNMQPAGKYLGEEFHRAGGVPAVVHELMKKKLVHEGAITANGKPFGVNNARRASLDHDVIAPIETPLREDAGFIVLKGNLFNNAIMKTSVISEEFAQRYLSNPADPGAFEGRAIVFEGPEDYHHRIDDPALAIDEHCLLFIRGTGPIGYPGGAEVVNMQPPAALIKKGIHSLPCIGDGRQSGHLGLALDPQRLAGGGGGRRARDPEDGRPRAHRPPQAHGRHADSGRRTERPPGNAPGPWWLSLRRQPDALAGDPARHGRPVRRGHGAQAGGQVPARRADHGRSARQSLEAASPVSLRGNRASRVRA